MRHMLMTLVAALGLGILQGCATPVVAAGTGSGKSGAIVEGTGVGVGAMITMTDRRTAGTMVEDDSIESKAHKRVDDSYKDVAYVSVTAFNRFALITGSAPNDATKMDIERIVGSIPNVKGIANELEVGSTHANSSATSDEHLTGNVKFRFIKNPTFKADNIKVVTYNNVVYLMGLVSHAEADAASEIASTTAGVQKVVRVFEYID